MDYFAPVQAEYRKRRDILYEGLKDVPGIVIGSPQGAFYFIARLPVRDAEHFVQWMLTDFSLNGKTVMVAPGPGFYSTPGRGADEVRIAYVLKEEDMREAVEILKAGLAAYTNEKKG